VDGEFCRAHDRNSDTADYGSDGCQSRQGAVGTHGTGGGGYKFWGDGRVGGGEFLDATPFFRPLRGFFPFFCFCRGGLEARFSDFFSNAEERRRRSKTASLDVAHVWRLPSRAARLGHGAVSIEQLGRPVGRAVGRRLARRNLRLALGVLRQ